MRRTALRGGAEYQEVALAAQGHHRHVESLAFAPPPCSSRPLGRFIGEVVRIYHGADIAWRGVREGVVGEQTNYGWSPLQQPLYKISEPGIGLGTPQGREPHLPIEP